HHFYLCLSCLFFRELVQSIFPQKKTLFHSWFQLLVLFCVLALGLCYTLSSSSLSLWQNFPLQEHYQWFLNQSSRVNYHQAYPRNYHFLMDNTEVCKNKIPFLVLMVPVAPKMWQLGTRSGRHGAKKTQFRVSWYSLYLCWVSLEDDVEKLKQENLQHHDLIQSDFIDSYLNLTIKTMVIMDWLTTHCPAAAYAMKIDSDMFLNADNLVIMLKQPGIPKTNYLTGMLMWNRPVIRSKNSKWYVPEEMYPESEYPTYTLGMGYVFSNDLPEKFVEISKSIKPFNIEDAYIGMCMKKLGLAPTAPPKASQFKAYNSAYNRCEFSQVITYILGSSKQLLDYWTDLKKPGPPCS
uniref:Hexosyltransferase n=1 Tax=Oreochromis aureus TaxID=47969 RepID=A0AAZ1XW58_OREAU